LIGGEHLDEAEKTNDETQNKDDEENSKKGKGRYVFECQRCGECCEKKESVIVSISDLERWNKDMTLPSLYPFLTMQLKDDYVEVCLKKPEGEKDTSGCPLYDPENKLCNIYYSMPLYCKSFPLGYDGKSYFLKDKGCPGIGKGKMTDDRLIEARSSAKDDFEARVSTAMLLPVIQGLAVKFLLEQSKKQMESLTDEQKEKLREVFGEEDEGTDNK
jgi:Fe-S-cluster containining protein